MVTIKPITRSCLLLAGLLLFLLASGTARAGINMYLSIANSSGPISGEVTNTGFVGDIWVTNFSWSVANSDTAVGVPVQTKPVFGALTITKTLDLASPVLMEDCAVSQPITSAVLSFQSQLGIQPVFYTITLANGFVTSVNSSGSTADGRPLETITLIYNKITWEYQQLDQNGNPVGSRVKHSYDLSTGTGS